MLYDTLSQPSFVLILMLAGFLCGFLYDAKNLFLLSLSKKKVTSNILDFLCTFLSLCILYLVNLHFHYGILRFYPILVFFFAFFIQRLLSKKVFTILIVKCYNRLKRKKDGTKKL